MIKKSQLFPKFISYNFITRNSIFFFLLWPEVIQYLYTLNNRLSTKSKGHIRQNNCIKEKE